MTNSCPLECTLLERIHKLETEVSNLTTEIRFDRQSRMKLIEELSAITKSHDITLYGGPKNSGFREQLNNLEKIEEQRKKHIVFLTFAVTGSLVNIIFQWVRKLFNF